MTTFHSLPRIDRAPLRYGGIVGLLVLVGVLVPPAHAQRGSGSVNLGFQVGQPGGVTLKLYRNEQIAYDGLFTIDGDDFARVSVHRVWERPLPDSLMYLYYGPGMFIGGQNLDVDPTLEIGLRAKLGLNFYADRFEVFLHVAPGLHVRPDLDPHIAAGVGLRYDLHQP